MKNACRAIVAFIFIVSCSALTTHAQGLENHLTTDDESMTAQATDDDTYRLHRGTNEFGVWGGAAFNATTIFGGITDEEARGRKFILTGLRYGRVLGASDDVSVEYTLDVIPLAVATNNIENGTLPGTTRRETAYGAGLAPLGLKLIFGQKHRVKPFIGVTGGFLIFNEPVPLPDSSTFAFTADGSAGIQIHSSKRRAVELGIKLHHISNGDRSGSNRGLNSFIFYAGFSIFR